MTNFSKTLHGEAMSKDLDRLNQLIKERYKDYPRGHTLDDPREWALKAVYRDIMEGFSNLKEAKEYVEGFEGDRVIYTARGHEIPFSLIKDAIKHIERNPFYSPWRETQAMPGLISRQPLFQGKAYRVDIPNWGIPGNATAGDIVRFEQKELGNDLGVPDDLIKELDKYRYSDVVWVTKKKADAEFYLSEGMTKADIWEFTLGKGARIVANDKQGGFLVLFGDARPNPQAAAMTGLNRGDNLLQYYKVPPSAD
jgi:hypothetical protein